MTVFEVQILLIFVLYVLSVLFFAILYKLAPPEYERINLDELSPTKQRDIVKLLYDSYLARLSFYHSALISCIFGVFIILTLLATKGLSEFLRLIVLWIGLALVGFTMFISVVVLTMYHALHIIETSYEVGSKSRKTFFEYFAKVFTKSANILNWFPVISKMSKKASPKYTIFVIGAFWLIFILPIVCLMLLLCFF